MSKLTPELRAQIELAERAGILQDVNGDKTQFEKGVIAVMCADGDQPGKKKFLAQLVAAKNGCERVHALGGNGGALMLSPTSPLSNFAPFANDFLGETLGRKRFWAIILWLCRPLVTLIGIMVRQDIPLIINIWAAIKLKKITTVALYAHAPCGAATLCRMDFFDELYHLVRAKKYLKSWLGHFGIKVPCFVHVNFGDHEKTWVIKRADVEAWLRTKEVIEAQRLAA